MDIVVQMSSNSGNDSYIYTYRMSDRCCGSGGRRGDCIDRKALWFNGSKVGPNNVHDNHKT